MKEKLSIYKAARATSVSRLICQILVVFAAALLLFGCSSQFVSEPKSRPQTQKPMHNQVHKSAQKTVHSLGQMPAPQPAAKPKTRANSQPSVFGTQQNFELNAAIARAKSKAREQAARERARQAFMRAQSQNAAQNPRESEGAVQNVEQFAATSQQQKQQQSKRPQNKETAQSARQAAAENPAAPAWQKTAAKPRNIGFFRIAFVGDSHIAADFMSARFREQLGIQSLGFFPPMLPKWHRIALVNFSSRGAKLKYLINSQRTGFSGISARCDFACNIRANLGFFASNPRAIVNGRQIPLKPGKILNLYAQNADVIGFLTGNERFVDNLGVNGASVFNYQRAERSEITEQIDYELVIFSFGTNESVAASVNPAAIAAKMREIFSRFKHAQKLLLLPPEPVYFSSGAYLPGPSTEVVFTALREAAQSAGAWVFDVRELERYEGGREAWQSRGLASKNTHLTPSGYRYVADKLLDFLEAKSRR